MTDHKLIISEPGRGTIADIRKLAGKSGKGYIYRNFANLDFFELSLVLGELLNSEVPKDLKAHDSLTVVMDGVSHIGFNDLQLLTKTLRDWSAHYPELAVSFVWIVSSNTIIGRDLEHTVMALLPLFAQLYATDTTTVVAG